MRLIRLLFLLLFVAAPGLFAGACAPALLSVYDAPSFTCQVDQFTLKDVTYSLISGTITIADTDITVTPAIGVNNLSLKFSSAKFSVSGSDSAKYVLTYFWDPGDIRGFAETLDDPVVAPGLAQITTAYCENGEFGVACPPATITSTVFDNGTTSHLTDLVPFVGVTTVGVQQTIELDANGASASFTDFRSQLNVPEPSTWSGGLLALVIVLWQLRRPLGSRVRNLRL
jgi:hypothetical protein